MRRWHRLRAPGPEQRVDDEASVYGGRPASGPNWADQFGGTAGRLRGATRLESASSLSFGITEP